MKHAPPIETDLALATALADVLGALIIMAKHLPATDGNEVMDALQNARGSLRAALDSISAREKELEQELGTPEHR